ncbi:methyltransferase [Microbacterium pseudoresistens]|uniref:16S rRNA (Guanine1207-N2)-methyltransferase n=1 Tax=Microbacterium pseudoresistens TaxID=640634 RepID=A0A7Y9ETY0_9MICO|nr:16S rRNA (guanine1207-N2)-methyltransferase [Microbacterium pseudoresistens]
MPFPFAALRRFPDVEAPNLQAWDATDELLVARAHELVTERGLRGTEIAVIGDAYGAITLALAGLGGIRVHQDLVTGRRALARNAEALSAVGLSSDGLSFDGLSFDGLSAVAGFAAHELDRSLLDGARLVLLQLPKALAELDQIADAVARWAAPDAVLVAGGRVKHMTLAQNDVLARFFGTVRAQRAQRRSRLVVASDPRPVSASPAFPTRAEHPEFGIVLCAQGGVFAGDRIDIGTRVLLEVMDRMPAAARVVDLGCGAGALAAAYALRHPDARVIATDRSAAAVASARATMAENGLAERVTAMLDDAGSELPAGGTDLVLLNPPFHLGASVHEGAGRRLIDAAARLLRPGGEVWTVFNAHLDHRRALSAAVGETEQIVRTPKFTVTRSVRR